MRRPALAIVLAASFLLAACGTSGGGDSATTTAAEAPANGESAPTTTPDAGGEGDPSPAEVTGEQLEAILPTAEDLGPEWVLDELVGAGEATDDDEADGLDAEDPTDAAIAEACPEAAALDFGDDSSPEDVSATFSTEQDLGMEVSLGPVPPRFTEAGLDEVIAALAECTNITLEEDGIPMSMDIAAERSDEFGDYGARIEFDIAFSVMGQELALTLVGNLFVVDGVAVGVVATSGFDAGTGELVDAPLELLAELSTEMEGRVRAL
jgi:hypothetical protein